MSFLSQTGGDGEKMISEYMDAFGVNKTHAIKRFPSLRLRNILDLFEKIEGSLQTELVEMTDPKYRAELTNQEMALFRDEIIRKHFKEGDLALLKAALGRLCTRQLSGNQVFDEKQSLFTFLFFDENAYLFGIPSPSNVGDIQDFNFKSLSGFDA
jgi:hypothetical protein